VAVGGASVRRLLLIAVVALASREASAQRLFGNVFLADDRTPAAGAIVTVTDSLGRFVGRELASARGDYVIPLSRPGKFTITAQRVGSLTDAVRDVNVDAGQDVRTRVVLRRDARRPAQVAQRTRGVCDLAADTSGLAGLWDQFQIAIATTEIAESTKAFVATWNVRERILSAYLRDTTGRNDSEERVPIDVPVFPVTRPDTSERLGFVMETTEGVKYHTPGLATFRSPGFLNRRCFAFEPAPDGLPGWIGLHFWATGIRIGTNEVEGTIWFDQATLEPRAMTYVFTGLPPAFAAARSGGALRFRRLPTGHWIADEWTIRVPSGRFQRMYAYDTHGTPNGFGNLRLDGVRIAVATLVELTVNGSPLVRRPQ
jgi:hypothetical protein